MKQDVREGGERVEYLNCWSTEATLELKQYSLIKLGAVNTSFLQCFPPLIVNNLQNYYCTTQHHPGTEFKTLGYLSDHKHCTPNKCCNYPLKTIQTMMWKYNFSSQRRHFQQQICPCCWPNVEFKQLFTRLNLSLCYLVTTIIVLNWLKSFLIKSKPKKFWNQT